MVILYITQRLNWNSKKLYPKSDSERGIKFKIINEHHK